MSHVVAILALVLGILVLTALVTALALGAWALLRLEAMGRRLSRLEARYPASFALPIRQPITDELVHPDSDEETENTATISEYGYPGRISPEDQTICTDVDAEVLAALASAESQPPPDEETEEVSPRLERSGSSLAVRLGVLVIATEGVLVVIASVLMVLALAFLWGLG